MSIKLPLILTVSVLWLTACAQQPVLPAQLQIIPPLSALAAEYVTTVSPHDGHDQEPTPSPQQWRFWRDTQFIETLNLADQSGDNWSKATDGTVTYQRLFHEQKQLVDYLPGDLKAIGIAVDWTALATLIKPSLIAGLKADDRVEVLGHSAIHYQSTDPEKPFELLWLEQEQLPALIKFTEHGHTVSTELTALYPLAQSPWPYQRAAAYKSTDFSDLGDKENDPFVKSIQHKLKGGHGHDH